MNRSQKLVIATIQIALTERGMAVEEMSFDDGELSMTLQFSEDDEGSWLEDLDYVLGAYCGALRNQGWNVGIDHLVVQFTGTEQFETHGSEAVQLTVQTEWAEALSAGNLSMAEYRQRAQETAQVVDADGDVHDAEDALQEEPE